jgi:hypothetical protein
MKLKQNFSNLFDCVCVINGIEYLDVQIDISYHIGSDKKYFYKITSTDEFIQDFFGIKCIEGVKGFGQHIVSNDKYHLIYKEKSSKLEVITTNNSVFIDGKLKF